MSEALDILHSTPRHCLAQNELKQALVFAFATGGGSDAFSRLYARIEPTPSDFSPECFAKDLFIATFVDQCLDPSPRGRGEGYQRTALTAWLTHPPSDRADVELRRDVFRELLASPDC